MAAIFLGLNVLMAVHTNPRPIPDTASAIILLTTKETFCGLAPQLVENNM